MKPIKIIHLSDVHFCPDKKDEALASLETARAKGQAESVDLFAIAGDLFDRAIQNTANSGLPELQRVIQDMMDVAPVVAISGTPTHDAKGCYEVLQETTAEHSFTVLDPWHAYHLVGGEVYSDHVFPNFGERLEADLLILGCPEPSKEWFLKDKRMGGDEANEAIINGMKGLLLGFAATRNEHPSIPCLLVYHGNVAGATMCNGQAVRPGELTIGRDDLALVGADYYALGHIHLAQQIGDLPAFYAGSAYPINWGELDQKQFNLVTLLSRISRSLVTVRSEEGVKYQHIPFPHPPRKKIVQTYEDRIFGYLGEEIRGYQSWEVIRGTKEEIATVDIDEELATLLKAGALPGSKVTTEIIPTETVRAGRIQEANSLRAKVEIYAENSGETASLNILAKAAELEAEAQAAGDVGEGLHISIDKLILRGAIGIWKGQGKDELALDMGSYDAGLVALSGVNGAGKTTLIENMHPFPEMLTRSGKLQDHFRLRDSCRDLYFQDHRTMDGYRAFIQIDGQNASGKCEYHLYKNGQPLTDGRKDSYVDEITKLFGSQALFMRSAFVSQKPTKANPDLSEATKGEKRTIFRELGGLDYLQAYAENAKENVKSFEGEIIKANVKINMLEPLVATLPETERELRATGASLEQAVVTLGKAEAAGFAAKAEKEELEDKLNEQREIEQKIDSAKGQQEKLNGEKTPLCASLHDYRAALEEKPAAEKSIQQYEGLKAEEAKLNEEKGRILEEREKLLAEYRNAQDIANETGRKNDAKKAEIWQKTGIFRTKKDSFLKDIDRLQKELEKPLDDRCPTCGQVLPEGKLDEIRDQREQKQADLKKVQSEVWELDKEIPVCEKQITELEEQTAAIVMPKEPELLEFDESALREFRSLLAQYNIEDLRRTLSQAQEAEVRIEESSKRIVIINASLDELDSETRELRKQLDSRIEAQYQAATEELDAVTRRYREASVEAKGLEVEHKSLEGQIATLKAHQSELHQIIQSIKEMQQQAADWRYLEKACGPNGIQALELHAMGPGIADVANELLSAAYGSRFQIRFETQKLSGQGSKIKMIEDFQIMVLDSEHGDEQLLETLSGGQSVWVKRAIYDAFGIIRDHNTGQRFLTAFQDESDGALDPAARIAYFRMLEAAHQESGRRHTIVITHSESAQEMIAQKIEMAELAAPEVAEVVA